MSGSKIAPEHMHKLRQVLKRHGFPSQNSLAVSLGLSRSTVTNFFNGKRIAHINFVEISERLGLDWEEIVYKDDLDNPELNNKQICIPSATRELAEMRTKTLLAKSNYELQVVFYDIDAFLARYPNNTEALILRNTVDKALLQNIPKDRRIVPKSCKIKHRVRLTTHQLLLYEIEEFIARYPNNTEARILKNTEARIWRKREARIWRNKVEKALLRKSANKTNLSRKIHNQKKLSRVLIFLLITLTTVGLLYALYIFVKWVF